MLVCLSHPIWCVAWFLKIAHLSGMPVKFVGVKWQPRFGTHFRVPISTKLVVQCQNSQQGKELQHRWVGQCAWFGWPVDPVRVDLTIGATTPYGTSDRSVGERRQASPGEPLAKKRRSPRVPVPESRSPSPPAPRLRIAHNASSRLISSARRRKTVSPWRRMGSSHAALSSSQVAFMKLNTRPQ